MKFVKTSIAILPIAIFLLNSCEESPSEIINEDESPVLAPIEVIATIEDYHHIQIEWISDSSSSHGHEIERQLDTASYVSIGLTDAEIDTYIDTINLYSLGSDFITYRIKALGKSMESDYQLSNTLSKQFKIAFFSSRMVGEGWEIFLMNSDGSDVKRLTENEATFSQYPAWSHDGSQIAYISSSSGITKQIHLINQDGTSPRLLTTQNDIWIKPEWSPDDSKIAYKSYDALYLINSNGANETRIVSSHLKSPPSWSPDGAKLTFVTYDMSNEPHRLNVINSDGTDWISIISDTMYVAYPKWSPDGTNIVFSSLGNIYIINPDGSDLTQLTDDQYDNGFPSFTPNGGRIVYHSKHDGIEMWSIMDTSGMNQNDLVLIDGYVVWPRISWSPAGDEFAYTVAEKTYGCSNCDVWVVNIDERTQTNLTSDYNGIDSSPDWSPLPIW